MTLTYASYKSKLTCTHHHCDDWERFLLPVTSEGGQLSSSMPWRQQCEYTYIHALWFVATLQSCIQMYYSRMLLCTEYHSCTICYNAWVSLDCSLLSFTTHSSAARMDTLYSRQQAVVAASSTPRLLPLVRAIVFSSSGCSGACAWRTHSRHVPWRQRRPSAGEEGEMLEACLPVSFLLLWNSLGDWNDYSASLPWPWQYFTQTALGVSVRWQQRRRTRRGGRREVEEGRGERLVGTINRLS